MKLPLATAFTLALFASSCADKAQVALDKFIEQCKQQNCVPQSSYITSIGLTLPSK